MRRRRVASLWIWLVFGTRMYHFDPNARPQSDRASYVLNAHTPPGFKALWYFAINARGSRMIVITPHDAITSYVSSARSVSSMDPAVTGTSHRSDAYRAIGPENSTPSASKPAALASARKNPAADAISSRRL